MRTCKGCGERKDESDYFKNSIRKDGLDAKCKLCRKTRAKEWIRENRDSLKVSRARWYQENRDRILRQKHIYNAENAVRISEAGKKRRRECPEKAAAAYKRTREWSQKNKEAVLAKSKERRQEIVDGVLDLLGPSCSDCGEKEREFLTVDHVNADGREERGRGSIGWKRALLRGVSDPSRYRVLCHNCNQARYRRDPVHHLPFRPRVGTIRKCTRCGIEKDLSEMGSQSSHHASVCLFCQRAGKWETVLECQRYLGSVCQCCGEGDPYKLTIDHVDGRGSTRRKLGERSGVVLCRKILTRRFPKSDFQLLCWNCNFSKHLGCLCLHVRYPGLSGGRRFPTQNKTEETIDFDFLNVVFERSTSSDVSHFFNEHHYAGFGRPAKAVYSAVLDGEILASAKFSSPVRQGVAPSFGLSHEQVLELDRMCIHPRRHKRNMASFILSRITKLVAHDFSEVVKLVSFADPRFGHSGVVYKAANWDFVGMTSKSYFYRRQDGIDINKKSVYDWAKRRSMKEAEAVSMLGLKKVILPAKFKFSYDLRLGVSGLTP